MGSSTTHFAPPGAPASAGTPGLMSAAQFTALNAFGAYQMVSDWTTVGDKGVIVPARVGAAFIPQRFAYVVVTQAGVASGTAPFVNFGWTAGSNYADIGSSAAFTVGNINAGPGQSVEGAVTGIKYVDNVDLHVYIVTAVTGATVLTVSLTVYGSWVAF